VPYTREYAWAISSVHALHIIYVSKLAETEFSNPNYRSENLKVNLEKTYGKKIMFIKMETHGKFESYLVASSDIDLEDRSGTLLSRAMANCFLHSRTYR
jgi:hypothetical protein